MKRTTVINLFGGPGSGKSTVAAGLFTELKKLGRDVEMVREWVKLWAWEGKKMTYADQVVVFGNQVREETALYNKVDIIITDSPLILSGFYEEANYGTTHLIPAAKNIMKLAETNDVYYWNLFLKRQWPYQVKGRFQNEAEANELDKKMIKFLKTNKLTYENVIDVKDIMLEILQ